MDKKQQLRLQVIIDCILATAQVELINQHIKDCGISRYPITEKELLFADNFLRNHFRATNILN